MKDHGLLDSIVDWIAGTDGRVGVCAETIDGARRLAINADEIYPTASSIKMYILFALLAQAERGQVSLAERLEFTRQVAQPGSGVLYHLDPGLQITLKDLATLMMMISDNSALIMLSGYLGLDTINAEITRLGLKHTRCGDWRRFETDYADSASFGTATPCEFVEFLLRMQRAELLGSESTELFWDILRIQKYIEPLRRHLPASPWSREFNFPEPVWVASKSGMLDDCTGESGLVRVHDGGWVISIMARDIPLVDRPEIGEDLISNISLRVYDAWAPLFNGGESR
ncbi:MAG: serine hydrolase [Gammaproteobacteria bacterium]|nr:serine hydrolase [Gammaproteobacteria bacterium]